MTNFQSDVEKAAGEYSEHGIGNPAEVQHLTTASISDFIRHAFLSGANWARECGFMEAEAEIVRLRDALAKATEERDDLITAKAYRAILEEKLAHSESKRAKLRETLIWAKGFIFPTLRIDEALAADAAEDA